jgi:hypothetical protein
VSLEGQGGQAAADEEEEEDEGPMCSVCLGPYDRQDPPVRLRCSCPISWNSVGCYLLAFRSSEHSGSSQLVRCEVSDVGTSGSEAWSPIPAESVSHVQRPTHRPPRLPPHVHRRLAGAVRDAGLGLGLPHVQARVRKGWTERGEEAGSCVVLVMSEPGNQGLPRDVRLVVLSSQAGVVGWPM